MQTLRSDSGRVKGEQVLVVLQFEHRVDRIIESKDGKPHSGVAMKPDVWEIVRNKDGTFDMFHQGKSMHSSIPDKWLRDQVGRYGFCGQEYEDIRRQLDQGGKAKIVL